MSRKQKTKGEELPAHLTAPITADHPEGEIATQAFRAAYKKLLLPEDRAARVNANREFSDALASVIERYSLPEDYVNEEVKSDRVYGKGYTPRPLGDQISILRILWPSLGSGFDSNFPALPHGAEALFAIPRWEKLGKTYGEAVISLFDMLSRQSYGSFSHGYHLDFGSDLCQSEVTKRIWNQIGQAQHGHDILVIPAQFGIRHRGRSVRRARTVYGRNEFSLGVFAVGIMLLTHPERLSNKHDLAVRCAGDDYKKQLSHESSLDWAPQFSVESDTGCRYLEFHERDEGDLNRQEETGSATGWATPQT